MDSKHEAAKMAFHDTAVPLPPTNVVAHTDHHVGEVRAQYEQYLEWAVLEIAHWKDKCTELEVELASVEAYEMPDETKIRIKRRGNF